MKNVPIRTNAIVFAGMGLLATAGTIVGVSVEATAAVHTPIVAVGSASAGACFSLAATMLQPEPKPDPDPPAPSITEDTVLKLMDKE